MSIQSLSVVLGLSLSCVGLSACSSDSNPDSGGAGSTSAGGSAPGAASGPSAAGGAGSAAGGAGSPPNQPQVAAGASSAVAGSASGGGATSGGSGGGAGTATTGSCTGTAIYKITLEVSWSDAQVGGKHYTTVIGGVHSADVSLWKLGGMATAGVKSMAEAGGTMLLASEVQAAISAGTAKSVIQFGGGNAPGTSSSTVEVTPSFPLVSFGSMLAPSPDWFVGVSSLSLCDAGAWVPSLTFDAVVYDAGTKDGADFDYGFPETQPHAPIGYSSKFPGNLPAGTMKFDKQ